MEILITSIQDFRNRDHRVCDLISKGLGVLDELDLNVIMDTLDTQWRKLRPELAVVIETEYDDRVYRDCFYSYYSTKLECYERNCIRLSLFEQSITDEDEFSFEYSKKIQDAYLGFIILRPLVNACIGRNVISPKAEKNCEDLAIREVEVKSSCMGYKLKVCGFPHSSQDGEMMSCAETTIWTMMEYLGNKYPIYKPILPSVISELSESMSFERAVPSDGLSYKQISNILKHNDLGCIVYDMSNPRFKELFTCYVESGFPLAVCLLDDNDTEGHAIVCVGRKNISKERILKVPAVRAVEEVDIKLKFWNTAIDEFVFNDDNMPCYQIAKFDEPVKHYEDEEWKNVKITHFIVPLHRKIYIDAGTAIDAANNLLTYVIKVPSGSVVRTFLTSSRSYKDYVAKNPDFSQDEKMRLLTMDMAKFIWITEYADVDSFCAEKANGIILIDATGHLDGKDISSIIFYQKGTSAIIYDRKEKKHYEYKALMATRFKSFKSNLRQEEKLS